MSLPTSIHPEVFSRRGLAFTRHPAGDLREATFLVTPAPATGRTFLLWAGLLGTFFGAHSSWAQTPSADERATDATQKGGPAALGGNEPPPPSAGLGPQTNKMAASKSPTETLNALIVQAAGRDDRLEVSIYEGASPRPACFADPACLTKVADQTAARLVLFGQLGQQKGMTTFTLDLLDVRTGIYTEREGFRSTSPGSAAYGVDAMVLALFARYFENRPSSARTTVIVVGLVPPHRGFADLEPPKVPWLLFGSGVVSGAGFLFLGGALTLYVLALERDLQAQTAVWQIDAWLRVQERNTYALASVMTLMVSAGLFLSAATGAAFWFLEDE